MYSPASIFQHLRFWYDEVELAALRGDVVIPDTGQGYLAIAQAWVDAVQAVNLQVTPGSKYALSYVRNVVSVEENAMDSWYQPFMLETEHFYFSYVRIFVPENEQPSAGAWPATPRLRRGPTARPRRGPS